MALLLGLSIGRLEDIGRHFGHLHIPPIVVALVAASFALIFIPVPYRDETITFVGWYWLAKLICHQTVVVFTIYGFVAVAAALHAAQRNDGGRRQ